MLLMLHSNQWLSLVSSGSQGKPLARKAIIACPATLVGNWRQVMLSCD